MFCFPGLVICIFARFIFHLSINCFHLSLFSIALLPLIQTHQVTSSGGFPWNSWNPLILLLSGFPVLLPSSHPGICMCHEPGSSLHHSSTVDTVFYKFLVSFLSWLNIWCIFIRTLEKWACEINLWHPTYRKGYFYFSYLLVHWHFGCVEYLRLEYLRSYSFRKRKQCSLS